MTYDDAIQFLFDLRWFGTKLGLANITRLAALTGNPHHQLRFIHVAGTNGKGSTCAMLESIYRAAGLRVGLFTSPHLVSFGERIQVNREPISQGEVVRLVAGLQILSREFPPGEQPTFFEIITVMALQHFLAQKCELVVWETGMGGRLDATNIVTPLASLITNVQLDHEKYLGATLPSITAEKAGIIKPGVPVITAADQSEVLEVIRQTALQQQAPLTVVSAADAHRPPLDKLELPLRGPHQKINAALALATVQVLSSQIPVGSETVSAGLKQVRWAGRLQLLTQPSGRKILLDGAHNLAGVQALATAFQELFPSIKPVLILGILGDKDYAGMCRSLAPLAEKIFCVPVASERTATPEELQRACQEVNPSSQAIACTSAAEALERTGPGEFVLATGSLYLIGELLDLLQKPSSGTNERALNEWTAKV